MIATMVNTADDLSRDVGLRLRAIREAHGLSQRELARRAGVTNGFISQLESAKINTSLSALKRVLDGIPLGLSEFFAFEPQRQDKVFFSAEELTEIGKGSVCRLVPGTTYFHYTQNGREALSRVSPDEWTNYDTYHGKYLYDFDFAFRRLLDDDMETEPAEQLLPRVVATQPQALCFSEPEPVAAPVPVAPAPICSVLSRW